jgi:hypothetical protein
VFSFLLFHRDLTIKTSSVPCQLASIVLQGTQPTLDQSLYAIPSVSTLFAFTLNLDHPDARARGRPRHQA